MAVPDIFRNVTRNVKEALSSREGFKEKAKDLPLYVLQSALSGVGQVLLIGDRMRTSVKRLAGQDESSEESRPESEKAAASVEIEEKPVRREPVIFAPRPESAAGSAAAGTTPEANGSSSRPEPVIFAPTKSKATENTENKVTEKVTEPEPAAPEAEAPKEQEAPKPTGTAETAETLKVTEPAGTVRSSEAAKTVEAAGSAKTETAEAQTAEAAETEPTKAKAKAKSRAKAAEPAEDEASETGIELPAPAAVQVEVTEVKVVKAAGAGAASAKVTETRIADPAVAEPVPGAITVPAEPMPGYGQLTVASLRARMRGKSAGQIGDLLAYERATTARPEVVRMYENRLVKLESAE
ncbi:hypothetical protein [Streptosporangium sp. NBC_01756]|uniref:hypothetical protein n=1 Tax=Streptosporangium sp. NBC_01756 TaxID=2975950 RepID=UPI002DD9135C|nr:hypothetical protein [Streptosporangium sp. NBC_01756]WSC89262.1 hypothetical protein OIE48_14065 [Streptosporangium sp. NBC_01756]